MSAEAISAAVAEQEMDHQKHLEKRALKGTGYVVIAYGLAMGLRLVSSMVLSRLFAPAYFGLMALTSTIIVGLFLLSHLGLEDGVIQSARGEERNFLFTAWTLQVIRGAGLFLITIPLAFPIAAFYHERLLLPMIPLLGLTCIIGAFSSPSLLVLARQMGVARVSLLELLTSLVQFAATAIWALIHADIWALVGGKLISEVVRTIASYWIASPLHPKFVLERKAVGELLRFGRWILLSTALTFFALQSDRLILGKLVSWQMLGIYGIAYTLSDVPRQIISQFASRVGYPFIARFSALPRPEFRTVLMKYRGYVLALGAFALTLVITMGDQFIQHVYDKRYHQASWMVVILGCGLWHTLLGATMTPVLLSIQKAYYHTIAMVCYCATLFICLPLGFHFFGMLGAVIAVAVSDFPVYVVTTIGMMHEGISFIRQDLKLTLFLLALLSLALVLRHALGLTSPFHYAL
jgi:O-antigen/teichoic acid export membrane protein